MSRRDLQFIEGEYYHAYNRGRNREQIFREAANYAYLRRLLKDATEEHSVSVIAYCFMPNHYHFLLRQDSDVRISDLIQDIFNRYSKAFNKRYRRSGTLFEERFKAKHIDREEYLIHLCRYIHRNPLEAGLVKSLEEWEFSNYLEWIGTRNSGLIDRDFVAVHFRTPQEYAKFVVEYESPKAIAEQLKKYLVD